MSDQRVSALAREMLDAAVAGQPIPVPPSAREGGLDLDTGYAVEAEITRLRRASGRKTVGRKLGLGNRAVWQTLNLRTLVWGNMYDDTVKDAQNGRASYSLARLRAPRLEPEIVMQLKAVPPPGADAAAALQAVEWIAPGFEIVDCPYPGWKFTAGDFIASLALHAGLVIGERRPVRSAEISALVDQLASFKSRLLKNDEVVAEGGGQNVLGSPALALAEFASAVAAQAGAESIRPGEIITTGSTTAAPPIAAGERWTMEVTGLELSPLTVGLL